MGGADEHGGRQSVIRARPRTNGHPIVLERDVDVLAHVFARPLGELGGAQIAVALVVVIHAIDPVRHPAGVGLDAHDAQRRMPFEHAAEDEHRDEVLDLLDHRTVLDRRQQAQPPAAVGARQNVKRERAPQQVGP